jgi:hypothetical protein
VTIKGGRTPTTPSGAGPDAPRRYLFLPPLLLIASGAAVAVLVEGTTGSAIAIFLIGVGCVYAVSAVFWQVGRSEDREREGR